jgi:hypothetical protein
MLRAKQSRNKCNKIAKIVIIFFIFYSKNDQLRLIGSATWALTFELKLN